MRINEYFPAIQGEGPTVGLPVFFLRLSGCNLDCDWCDTKYHKDGNEMSVEEVTKIIKGQPLENIVITGGEPMLQKEEMFELMDNLTEYYFHLETNGSYYDDRMGEFETIACSPKRQGKYKSSIGQLNNLTFDLDIKFKFVYEPGKSLWWEDFASKYNISYDNIMIMPLGATLEEQQTNMPKVMEYCLEKEYKFSPRLHVLAYSDRRGV